MKRDKDTYVRMGDLKADDLVLAQRAVPADQDCGFWSAHHYHHGACCEIGRTQKPAAPERKRRPDLYELVEATELKPGDQVRFGMGTVATTERVEPSTYGLGMWLVHVRYPDGKQVEHASWKGYDVWRLAYRGE